MPRKGQPKAKTAVCTGQRFVAKGKGFKKLFPKGRIHAGAAVGHHKKQAAHFPLPTIVRVLHAALHSAGAGILNGIVQQNAQHLFQVTLIAFDNRGNCGINGKIEFQMFFQSTACHTLPQQFKQTRQVKGAAFAPQQALVCARKIKDAVDHVEQHAARLVYLRNIVALHPGGASLKAQITHADDGVERGAYFVAHAPQKIFLHVRGFLGQLKRGKGLRPGKHGLLFAFAGAALGLLELAYARKEGSLHALQGLKHVGKFVLMPKLDRRRVAPLGHVLGIAAYLAKRLHHTFLKNIDIDHCAGTKGQQGNGHGPDHLRKRALLKAYLVEKTAVLHLAQGLSAEQNLLHFAVQVYPVGPGLRTAQIKAVPVPVRWAAVAHGHADSCIKQRIEVFALGQQ